MIHVKTFPNRTKYHKYTKTMGHSNDKKTECT